MHAQSRLNRSLPLTLTVALACGDSPTRFRRPRPLAAARLSAPRLDRARLPSPRDRPHASAGEWRQRS